MILINFIILNLFISTNFCQQINFQNFSLYSVDLAQNDSVVNELEKLRQTISIDFWDELTQNKDKVNFLVAPSYQWQLEQHLNKTLVKYDIITSDLQQWIDRERNENNLTDDETFLAGRRDVPSFKVDYYHPYNEVSKISNLKIIKIIKIHQ